MAKYDYLIQHPIKMRLNIANKTLEYFIPESKELVFPLKIYYYRFDMYGSSVTEMDEIQDEKEYIKTIAWLRDCECIIRSIGDIRFDDFYDYLYRVKELVRKIASESEKFESKIKEFADVNKIDRKDKLLQSLEDNKNETLVIIKRLLELLPTDHSWGYFPEAFQENLKKDEEENYD